MSFGADMEHYVISHLSHYTELVYQMLVISWPAQTLTSLYIVIGGYMMLMGNAGKHAKDMGLSMILLVILQTVVQSGFDEWVSTPVISAAQGLAHFAADPSGTRGVDVFQSLDDGLGQIMTTVDRIEPTGNIITNSWIYVKVVFASALMTIAYCIMYVVFLTLYLIAFFSIYMMLMVGGIFLWLAAFKATRQYAMAWFKAILNYVLWVFFLSAVAGFFMDSITGAVEDLGKWDLAVNGAFPPSLGKMIFLSFLVTYLMLKTSDWSAQLTGGSSMFLGIVATGARIAGGAAGAASRAGAAGAAGAGIAGAVGAVGVGAARGIAGLGVRAFSALKGVK